MENIKEYIISKLPNIEFFNEPTLKGGYYYFTIIVPDWWTGQFENSIFEVVRIENRNNMYIVLKIESILLNRAIENKKKYETN